MVSKDCGARLKVIELIAMGAIENKECWGDRDEGRTGCFEGGRGRKERKKV